MMKKLIWILFVIISATANAQKMDDPDIIVPAFIKAMSVTKKPLIVVNDKIFKGNIQLLSPMYIETMTVLTKSKAITLYGEQGENGALLINLPAGVLTLIDPALKNEPVLIIDGELSELKLSDIDTANIYHIETIDRKEAAANINAQKTDGQNIPYRFKNGATEIITKLAAAKSYKRRLGIWSPEYRFYIQTMKGDDSDIIYSINGVQVGNNPTAKTKALYSLESNRITSVSFVKSDAKAQTTSPLVIIKTKN